MSDKLQWASEAAGDVVRKYFGGKYRDYIGEEIKQAIAPFIDHIVDTNKKVGDMEGLFNHLLEYLTDLDVEAVMDIYREGGDRAKIESQLRRILSSHWPKEQGVDVQALWAELADSIAQWGDEVDDSVYCDIVREHLVNIGPLKKRIAELEARLGDQKGGE